MSLLAGYYSFSNRSDQINVTEVVDSFQIDPTKGDHTYLTKHYQVPSGQVTAKYIDAAPPQIQFFESDNLVVILLGFHTLFNQRTKPQFTKVDNGDRNGAFFAERIKNGEGDYVAIVVDRARDSLHIINNRFAQRLFYIYPTGTGVYFSSNIVCLCNMLSKKIELDPVGWLQIFNFSHTIGSKTNVQNISRLLPATHLSLNQLGLKQEKYWELKYEVDHSLKPAEHAKNVFRAFEDSCNFRAYLGPNKFVSLSGGLDSRLVAGCMPKDSNFHTLTFVNSVLEKDTLEVQAAKEVSQILGVDQNVVILPQSAVSDIADSLIWLIGGLVPIQHPVKTWQSILEMRRIGGYVLGGGPGDTLAGSFVKSIYQLEKSAREQKVSDYFNKLCRFSSSQLQQIFTSDFLMEYWPSFEESVKQSYSNLSGETAAHTITAWTMIYRQPAFTFTSAIHTLPDTMGVSPHLGYEYTDLMLKLPAPWLCHKNFYQYMIYQCLPALRKVVYANTGKPLPGKMQNYTAQLLKKRITSPIWQTLKKTGLMPKRKQSTLPSNQTYEYSLLQKDTEVLNQTQEIIHSIANIKDIINVDGCDSFIKCYKNNELSTNTIANDAELMGSLITLCYWHKLWQK